ncbi:MAG: AGE family epimerase/isomerase, partial [Phycisphaerae bacterium]
MMGPSACDEPGCGGPHRRPLDLGWFKHHLVEQILPNWLAHAVTEEGLFLPHLDRRWQRKPGKNYGTLVSQSRLLYNFAQGYALTGEQAYLEAVRRGGGFLIEHFRDRKYGGWFWACSSDGRVVDTTKDSYGQAFAIFGLAHAWRATGDERFKTAALQTWQILRQRFTDGHGGLIRTMTRQFEDRDCWRSQNPVMHLFEALLGLADLAGMSNMLTEANRVAGFVVGRLLRDGRVLPEL